MLTTTPLRASLGTVELMALSDIELDAVSARTHTEATVRRAVIERTFRRAIARARAKAGLL